MYRLIVIVVAAVSMWAPPAHAYYEDEPSCNEGDSSCQQYDQNYGSRDDRNRNRDRNRGAFSPGPFDRSPVDIHDNNLCISPDCSQHGKEEKK